MKNRDVLFIRKLIGDCPTLEDEQIEYVWECMDKQEPLKPTLTKTRFGNMRKCPLCGANLDWGYTYCPHCGQHLKWEVSDEEVKDR